MPPYRPKYKIADIQPMIQGAKLVPTSSGSVDLSNYICDTYTLTAYCPCVICCGNTRGITSTGTRATAGRTIAVDPRKIPYGSHVVINGRTYIAEDCGGAIKGKRIDIFCNSHSEAIRFGRQKVKVYIKKK